MRSVPFLILVAVIGCAKEPAAKHPQREITKRLSPQTVAILSQADKVEVFRLDGHSYIKPKKKNQGERRICGFIVTGQGTDQGSEFASRLADILFDDSTYRDDDTKCFFPGVGFRVWKGEEVADVLLCFDCINIYAGPPTEEEPVTIGSFEGPRYKDLAALAKEVFPNDEQIQKLP
jgi:hypothetical protein